MRQQEVDEIKRWLVERANDNFRAEAALRYIAELERGVKQWRGFCAGTEAELEIVSDQYQELARLLS